MHLVYDGPKYVINFLVYEYLSIETLDLLVFHWRDFLEKEKTFNQIYLDLGIILKGCGYINMYIAFPNRSMGNPL